MAERNSSARALRLGIRSPAYAYTGVLGCNRARLPRKRCLAKWKVIEVVFSSKSRLKGTSVDLLTTNQYCGPKYALVQTTATWVLER